MPSRALALAGAFAAVVGAGDDTGDFVCACGGTEAIAGAGAGARTVVGMRANDGAVADACSGSGALARACAGSGTVAGAGAEANVGAGAATSPRRQQATINFVPPFLSGGFRGGLLATRPSPPSETKHPLLSGGLRGRVVRLGRLCAPSETEIHTTINKQIFAEGDATIILLAALLVLLLPF